MKKEQAITTTDSRYIQQHLANERTFLAWVRTAIAVVGLGFLAAGVVFRTDEFEQMGHNIAAMVGISSVLLGALILTCASLDYLKKRHTINNGTFLAPRFIIWLIFGSLALIEVFMLVLVILLFIL